jgi:hypothetical protein
MYVAHNAHYDGVFPMPNSQRRVYLYKWVDPGSWVAGKGGPGLDVSAASTGLGGVNRCGKCSRPAVLQHAGTPTKIATFLQLSWLSAGCRPQALFDYSTIADVPIFLLCSSPSSLPPSSPAPCCSMFDLDAVVSSRFLEHKGSFDMLSGVVGYIRVSMSRLWCSGFTI